ncbi:transglutaminase-like cysteine peptidase [Bradyrhizobium sp. sBnM-33]|uniref:transglutaminase-like cysteine peptidase n=1 Tax=Bradyrhizobium sp. sBnM-33 TaxID=2831780 RepID=UPI001BCCB2AA|nr:transglutaminase-like cysteine peptidase [Bradyrhizobium sp. sBnM-33]WOH53645.1 transglutaminase-like cysteine peptidase [Bradyrhizobium sp. sBnM-33]
MARHLYSMAAAILAGALFAGLAEARSRSPQDSNVSPGIVEASPTLAPFQHVRFCLRYPSDCKTSAAESDRIEFSTETSELLKRVNHSVNMSIIPASKNYGSNLEDSWTIAPDMGDCNDYAVTKRHELLGSGLPSRALRLSVVKTASGIGHLVLVVATTRGDLVMDNLTEAIRPWQSTGYQWLKIQSAADAKFWYEVKYPAGGPSISQADKKLRLADR